MRISALYDIHGNAPALEAVLAQIAAENVDAIVVGGDTIAGPMPSECLTLLRDLSIPIHWLWGNGESDVVAVLNGEEVQGLGPKSADVAAWVASQLSEDEKQFLRSWQMTVEMRSGIFGRILFCHATPQNNVDVFTKATPDDEARTIIGETDADLVICGHTHMQFDRQFGDLRVINAGSVGMSFGRTGAHWLLIGDEIELRRTEYDRESAAERIRQSNDPEREAFATGNVLSTPSEQNALGFMAAIAERQAAARK